MISYKWKAVGYIFIPAPKDTVTVSPVSYSSMGLLDGRRKVQYICIVGNGKQPCFRKNGG